MKTIRFQGFKISRFLGFALCVLGAGGLGQAQIKFNPGVKIGPGVRFSRAVMAQQTPALAQPIAAGSTSATFAQAQAAHNLNVVLVGWNDATQSITSVTDTTGNTYGVAAATTTYTSAGASLRHAIYYAKDIVGYDPAAHGGAGNVVTVAWD